MIPATHNIRFVRLNVLRIKSHISVMTAAPETNFLSESRRTPTKISGRSVTICSPYFEKRMPRVVPPAPAVAGQDVSVRGLVSTSELAELMDDDDD